MEYRSIAIKGYVYSFIITIYLSIIPLSRFVEFDISVDLFEDLWMFKTVLLFYIGTTLLLFIVNTYSYKRISEFVKKNQLVGLAYINLVSGFSSFVLISLYFSLISSNYDNLTMLSLLFIIMMINLTTLFLNYPLIENIIKISYEENRTSDNKDMPKKLNQDKIDYSNLIGVSMIQVVWAGITLYLLIPISIKRYELYYTFNIPSIILFLSIFLFFIFHQVGKKSENIIENLIERLV